MSDVKLNGIGQAGAQVVSISSSQKSQENVTAIGKQEPDKVDVAVKSVARAELAIESTEESKEKVRKAVTQLNDYVQSVQRNLQFNLDDASGKTIITVVDRDTSKVIRQIPDDVALKLAEELQQSEPLSLFNAKV